MKPTITHIPSEMGASGESIYKPAKDKGYSNQTINGQISAIPCAIYCPSCSDVMEVDRYQQLKRKFIINGQDLIFDISYQEDEEGNLYAKCNSCGFDLRNDAFHDRNNREIKKVLKPILRQHIVEEVKYRSGRFFIPKKDFIDLAKMYIQGDRVEICIRQKIGYNTYTYFAKDDVFENPKELVYENDEVGISRNYWKQKK
tara:strand:+ start:7104 stop:7703 length:600 start_codon:yes stop_codon:yes gene_type:complete